MSIHLVIPCYHESERIGRFLPALCNAVADKVDVSILIVEDGSGSLEQQKMTALVESYRRDSPALEPLLKLSENFGKGGAVYAGWAKHRGQEWLGFVDADGSCSPSEVVKLIERAGQGGKAFFASRVKMLGNPVERHFKRHLLGRVYATLVSELLSIPVYDSQCGLKIVPRLAYEKIAQRLAIHGFAFDVELMVALLDAGCEVEEVPISWQEVDGGKVRLLRDSWRMFRDILRIRQRRAAGLYR